MTGPPLRGDPRRAFACGRLVSRGERLCGHVRARLARSQSLELHSKLPSGESGRWPHSTCPASCGFAPCRAGCRFYSDRWWSRRESNPRPPECHSGTLPTELRPHADAEATPLAHGCQSPEGIPGAGKGSPRRVSSPPLPEWRNWYTQGTQNPPVARPCGFESRLRHQVGFCRARFFEGRVFRGRVSGGTVFGATVSRTALVKREGWERQRPGGSTWNFRMGIGRLGRP